MCPPFLWGAALTPCVATTPLKYPSSLHCSLPSSQVPSYTSAHAHLHPSPATPVRYIFTICGLAPGFCLWNAIIFSSPGSHELAWIKLGLHLFSGCFVYVNVVSFRYSIRDLRSGALSCFSFSSSFSSCLWESVICYVTKELSVNPENAKFFMNHNIHLISQNSKDL